MKNRIKNIKLIKDKKGNPICINYYDTEEKEYYSVPFDLHNPDFQRIYHLIYKDKEIKEKQKEIEKQISLYDKRFKEHLKKQRKKNKNKLNNIDIVKEKLEGLPKQPKDWNKVKEDMHILLQKRKNKLIKALSNVPKNTNKIQK